MAENNLSQLTPVINEDGLKYIEHEGQIFFSSEEIGRQLGYAKPSKSINILFNRNQRELVGYAVGIKLMSTDGKCYEMRHFSEEGVYIISMLANTPAARAFRGKLAKLLREIREQRVVLARQSGYEAGRAEALSPPALEAERKKGYLAGLAEGKRLAKREDRLAALEKIAAYIAKGLSQSEIGKILGISGSAVGQRIASAKRKGFWPGPQVRAILPGVE